MARSKSPVRASSASRASAPAASAGTQQQLPDVVGFVLGAALYGFALGHPSVKEHMTSHSGTDSHVTHAMALGAIVGGTPIALLAPKGSLVAAYAPALKWIGIGGSTTAFALEYLCQVGGLLGPLTSPCGELIVVLMLALFFGRALSRAARAIGGGFEPRAVLDVSTGALAAACTSVVSLCIAQKYPAVGFQAAAIPGNPAVEAEAVAKSFAWSPASAAFEKLGAAHTATLFLALATGLTVLLSDKLALDAKLAQLPVVGGALFGGGGGSAAVAAAVDGGGDDDDSDYDSEPDASIAADEEAAAAEDDDVDEDEIEAELAKLEEEEEEEEEEEDPEREAFFAAAVAEEQAKEAEDDDAEPEWVGEDLVGKKIRIAYPNEDGEGSTYWPVMVKTYNKRTKKHLVVGEDFESREDLNDCHWRYV